MSELQIMSLIEQRDYLNERVNNLEEEIQKRDELLEQAIVLLTQNTHKLSQEQWLKQYEELKR